MNHEIYVREAVTETETAAFWTQLYAYFLQDILPGSTEADRAYFLGAEYRKQIQTLHDRPQDALRYLFFSRDGQSLGFQRNGADEWGDPLLLLPPLEAVPFTVEVLADPEDWQLRRLENGYLLEIGEQALTKERQKRLSEAIRKGKITFFAAKRGYRAVGICSVVRSWSTFACGEIAVLEDFYIEPVFRRQGIARKLAQAAQNWCRANGIASLTVCCAPCDEGMYQALGFSELLGRTFAYLMQDM